MVLVVNLGPYVDTVEEVKQIHLKVRWVLSLCGCGRVGGAGEVEQQSWQTQLSLKAVA